jgi:predicted metal-dependent HD superfamily phosphohydrolase
MTTETMLSEQLETRWMLFAKRLGADMDVADEVYTDLVKAYYGPVRHYHSLVHIKACLDLLDAHVPVGADLNHVELALWWHDYVYIPGRSNNEEESTFAMHRAGRRMGLNEKLLAEVADMIGYTKHAASVETMADRYQYMVDIDLSILGETPEVFDQYEKDIRAEYEFVPWEQYRLGRGKILNDFLARSHIYVTSRFRSIFEVRARENLRRSLGQLVP